MQTGMDQQRVTHSPGALLIAVAATLVTGVVMTGCGSGPGGGTTTTSDGPPGALAFARCMRANGVPNFQDPQPGRGLVFPVPPGTNPDSPALSSARAKCQKFLPGGGPPGPGMTTHPSAQTVAKLLSLAQCMRQHGISDFPDPRTSVPSNPLGSGIRVITDYDGAILLFPSALNMQSPAYKKAAGACGALAEKIGRPH